MYIGHNSVCMAKILILKCERIIKKILWVTRRYPRGPILGRLSKTDEKKSSCNKGLALPSHASNLFTTTSILFMCYIFQKDSNSYLNHTLQGFTSWVSIWICWYKRLLRLPRLGIELYLEVVTLVLLLLFCKINIHQEINSIN